MVLQGTTYWTDLFVRHFLFQDEQAIDCDDLLFFVRKKHVKGSSRYLPKYEVTPYLFLYNTHHYIIYINIEHPSYTIMYKTLKYICLFILIKIF